MKQYYITHDSPAKGRIISDKEKHKISESLKEYYKKNGPPNKGRKMTEDQKKKCSASHKKRCLKWMNDGKNNILVPIEKRQEYLDAGFNFGRIINYHKGRK